MIQTSRRGFIGGLVASIAAPSVIRTPGLLMPVRKIAVAPTWRVPSGWYQFNPSSAQWQRMLVLQAEINLRNAGLSHASP